MASPYILKKKKKTMDGKPTKKPTISPIDYRGSKPTDYKKKKKKQYRANH